MTKKKLALRGARRREDVDLAQFEPLIKKWAGRYQNLLGFDDARGVALEALVAALSKWDPRRGPFAMLASWYVRSRLGEAADVEMRRCGVRKQDRPRSKFSSRRGHTYLPAQSYTVVSQRQLSATGEELDLFDGVPDDAPSQEDRLLAEEAAAELAARVRSALGG